MFVKQAADLLSLVTKIADVIPRNSLSPLKLAHLQTGVRGGVWQYSCAVLSM